MCSIPFFFLCKTLSLFHHERKEKNERGDRLATPYSIRRRTRRLGVRTNTESRVNGKEKEVGVEEKRQKPGLYNGSISIDMKERERETERWIDMTLYPFWILL